MTTMPLHPLAADYLDSLRRAARDLPPGRRDELVAEIEAHLFEAIDADAGHAEAQAVLDRLGSAEAIVAAEQPPVAAPQDPRGIHEWAAIFLLLFGGFVAGIGWVAGLILLWSSHLWTTRDKLVGTFVVPGGLAFSVFVLLTAGMSAGEVCSSVSGTDIRTETHCTGGTSATTQSVLLVCFVLVVLAPIVTAVYLARRARTAPATT